MTWRAPNTSRPTHERSEGTPEDSRPKHLLTGTPLIKGGEHSGNTPGTPRKGFASKERPGPKHLHTGSRTPIYRGGTFREHSGNGQEPLGNGGEQGTETARTNLWIDTQRIPAIDSSRRPGSKFSPYLITTFKTQKVKVSKIQTVSKIQSPQNPGFSLKSRLFREIQSFL